MLHFNGFPEFVPECERVPVVLVFGFVLGRRSSSVRSLTSDSLDLFAVPDFEPELEGMLSVCEISNLWNGFLTSDCWSLHYNPLHPHEPDDGALFWSLQGNLSPYLQSPSYGGNAQV